MDIVATAIIGMHRRGSFSICTINDIAALFDISVRVSEVNRAYSALHCIQFASMPASLHKKIPLLNQVCFTRVAIRFDPTTRFVETNHIADGNCEQAQMPSDTASLLL
ncbi:MAG: hypothetical protein JSS89_12865 [Bacteroidetes bacterium]|nr:hypothetical protein [Bacteroidota bacterium]